MMMCLGSFPRSLKGLAGLARWPGRCLGILLVVLAAGQAAADVSDDADIQLSKGNIILSNADGTQISMAPGSDVSLGSTDDGAPVVTLNTGEVYLSNVLADETRPMFLRMGDQMIEISRASVMVNRTKGAMNVTLLHGRSVNFSSGTPSLTRAGTRMQLGGGTPRVDRPSAGQMAAMKGAVGILSRGGLGGGPKLPPQGPKGNRGAALQQPAVNVPGQIVQGGNARPPAPPPPPTMAPPTPPMMPPSGGGGLPSFEFGGDGGFFEIVE